MSVSVKSNTNGEAGSIQINGADIITFDSTGNLTVNTLTVTGSLTATKSINLVGGNNSTLLGSIGYQSNTDTTTLLSPNTTVTKMFLSQTGTGTNGAAPSWSAVSKSDIGLSNVENTALSTWSGSSNITTIGAATATSLTVTGNLTVNGTTTTVNSTTVTVDDINIELGSVASPTNTTANGGGITLKGTTDKTIIWDSTNTNWTSSEHWNLATGKDFKINNTAVLSATTLGSGVTSSSLTSVGTIATGVWNATAIADSKIASALTGKTYNGLTLTANATGFSVAGGTASKTLTVNNSITLAGTDATTITLPSTSGTVPLNNQTMYIGTTALTINRSSLAQSLTGITSIDGSAATLTTARLIGDASFNGSADIVPQRIMYKDTRSANHDPFTYQGISLHLKTNTTDGLTDGGTYHGVLDLAHWSDGSGGVNHQIGLTDNGHLAVRYSTGASTWSSWITQIDSSNYTSYSPTLTGGGASGTWGINISGNAATSTTASTANALNSANSYTVAGLTVGNTTSSSILMQDTDEGARYIHCNSNRIGFLNQAGSWGAYCNDDGGWSSDTYITTGSYMWATTYVSTGDHYYLRSSGGERQVRWQQTGRDVYIYCRDSDKVMGVYDTVSGGRWTCDTGGNFVAVGNVTAYSDPRLKENVEKIQNPLQILNSIDGCTFNWKSGFEATKVKAGKRDYGVMADHVEAVMPEIVTDMASYDENSPTYKTVAYEKLVPVLIEAIKELEARVKQLESK